MTTRRGISPDTFVDRIHSAENITNSWPFGSMPKYSDISTETAYTRTPNGTYDTVLTPRRFHPATDKRSALVMFDSHIDRTGEFGKPRGSSIQYETSDSEMRAWELMTDVSVAVTVDVEGIEHYGANLRRGVIQRILGVEQPMGIPGRHYPLYARSKEGYVHGEVERAEAGDLGAFMRLRLGKEATAGYLFYPTGSQPILRRSNGSNQGALPAPGDTIRTRARRHPSGDIIGASGIVHILYPAGEGA